MSIARVLSFLVALENALPPGGGHHSLTRERAEGPQGWTDVLVLGVRIAERCTSFVLEEKDLEKPDEQLVREILGFLEAAGPKQESPYRFPGRVPAKSTTDVTSFTSPRDRGRSI